MSSAGSSEWAINNDQSQDLDFTLSFSAFALTFFNRGRPG